MRLAVVVIEQNMPECVRVIYSVCVSCFPRNTERPTHATMCPQKTTNRTPSTSSNPQPTPQTQPNSHPPHRVEEEALEHVLPPVGVVKGEAGEALALQPLRHRAAPLPAHRRLCAWVDDIESVSFLTTPHPQHKNPIDRR